jgi:lysophospholipase
MSNIKLLSEEDFIPAMEGEAAQWREHYVKSGDMTATDGTPLRYYKAKAPAAKGYIVMVHGFCELWGKYHEVAWYFWQMGYSIFFLEQRGYGYSGGKGSESDVVVIDSYMTYVEDLKLFMDSVVLTSDASGRRFLFAHSMGGAVAALFMEDHPGYFDEAILSSPMLMMKTRIFPEPVLTGIKLYGIVSGNLTKSAPGQRRWDGVNVFETSSTQSKPRYDYQFSMRCEDVHYQTYGASLSWGIASMRANRRLLRRAGRVKVPVTIFAAGADHLVDQEGYRIFAKKAAKVRIIEFPDSKHEIFNSTEDNRIRYYEEIEKILI